MNSINVEAGRLTVTVQRLLPLVYCAAESAIPCAGFQLARPETDPTRKMFCRTASADGFAASRKLLTSTYEVVAISLNVTATVPAPPPPLGEQDVVLSDEGHLYETVPARAAAAVRKEA